MDIAAFTKYKVGDRVKLVVEKYGIYDSNPVWGKHGHVLGTITHIGLHTPGSLPIDVRWDNDSCNTYDFHSLQIVSDKDWDE